MTYAERIRRKLTEGLNPIRLVIEDESAKHAGHAGARPGGETHFSVEVTAEAFRALTRVDRQRLVYRLLADELAERVHALRLKTDAP